MLKILTTREVATKIGKSVRRTQELIDGKTFPRLEVVENGRVTLGVRPEVLDRYLKANSKSRSRR